MKKLDYHPPLSVVGPKPDKYLISWTSFSEGGFGDCVVGMLARSVLQCGPITTFQSRRWIIKSRCLQHLLS